LSRYERATRREAFRWPDAPHLARGSGRLACPSRPGPCRGAALAGFDCRRDWSCRTSVYAASGRRC